MTLNELKLLDYVLASMKVLLPVNKDIQKAHDLIVREIKLKTLDPRKRD